MNKMKHDFEIKSSYIEMTTPIYCFNNSTVLKSSDMFLMINALNTLLPAFCTTWSLKQYYCVAAPAATKPVPNGINGPNGIYCVFLDTTDSPGALAYHSETFNVPFGKVFVKTILQYGGSILMGANNKVPTVAQAFSHEIFEILGNPNVNVWWQMSSGTLVPAEVVDPVEGNIVPVMIGSTKVGLSDYIFPVWSDPQNTKGPYNYLNTLTKPFQIAKGGYVVAMKNGSMTYIMGQSATPYIENKASTAASFFTNE